MNKKFKRSSLNTARILIYLVIVIVIVGLFAILPKIFSAQDMLFQTIAVVLSVVFTAVVTNQLLTGQSNNEEAREKNIKVYENKISVYADFISKMWAIMNDNKVEPEEIIALRSEIFNKLIFYLDNTQIDAISSELGKLKLDSSDQDYVGVFENITTVLRSSVMGAEQDDSKTDIKAKIKTLWNRFNPLLPEETEQEQEPELSPSVSEVKFDQRLNSNSFHFNMFSDDHEWQKNIFAKGVNALGLCEYGEVWRTNLIKRCRNNDVVFLYKTGGPGYIGVFLAKGWVVFEADGNGKLEKEIRYEFENHDNPIVVESEEDRLGDVDSFCAKELIENGSTLVSYLLVEPLVYYEEGVGRVSVYRKTISPYDGRYAWITLERFKSILESKQTEDIKLYSYKKETKNIKINEVLLKKLFNENGMVCSKWNSQV